MRVPITIYGIKNCETMKKARAWLDKHGVDYVFHDYKTAGIVAFFMLMGEIIETRTAEGARQSIESLIKLTPTKARRITHSGEEEVAAIFADPFLAEIATLLPHLDSLHRTLVYGSVRDMGTGRRRTA